MNDYHSIHTLVVKEYNRHFLEIKNVFSNPTSESHMHMHTHSHTLTEDNPGIIIEQNVITLMTSITWV